MRLPHACILRQYYSVEKDHPILKNLPEKIYPLPDLNKVKEPWFNPPSSVSQDVLFNNYPTKVYVGWFTSFSRDWRPLLYDEDSNHAVMIWRPYEMGAVIASTMFLASSFIPQLLRNIFEYGEFGQEMKAYVKSITESSRGRLKELILGFATAFILTMLGISIFGESRKEIVLGLGSILVLVLVNYEYSKKII